MAKLFVSILLAICVVKSMQGLVRQTIPEAIDTFPDAIINRINKMGTTWKAGHNFEGYPIKYVKRLTSVPKVDIRSKLDPIEHNINEMEIPDQFDARKQWPDCPTIGQIRDQGNCGSGWALSAVNVMSDRICIVSKGKQVVELSAEDMLPCCEDCGDCTRGYIDSAWSYWVNSGVVSGGQYKSKQGCLPYTLAGCEHYITGGKLPTCPDIFDDAPACHKQCEAGYAVSYSEDKHFGAKAYSIANDVKQIQSEILTTGPVEAMFAIYEDFIYYKSGVYQRHSSNHLGRDGVKILGWGVENGTAYWLVANSWNEDWGDHGYFKIIRGIDECGIEDNIYSGLPKV